MRLWTVGYAGHSLASFVETLRGAGVATLVDVRLNPISRKAGFSRRALSDALTAASIAYEHHAALGNPREIRDRWVSGDVAGAKTAYAAYLSTVDHAVTRLIEIARASPTAIMCLEAAPEDCHRSVLAAFVQKREPAVVVAHL